MSDFKETAAHEEFPPLKQEQAYGDDELMVWDAVAEKRLMRKIDWRLIPFLSLLYLLSFLDRVDGLEADLNLTGNQYSICLVVFFVGYVITETPSNIALKKLKPSRWIPLIMFFWGITMTCMGLVHNFGGLLATRFCLGLAEGICFYLTMWYKRDEANFRISLFFSAATLAGAFGGLIAYGISFMKGVGGKGGWAWIFILEGLLTFAVALIAPWMIDDFPDESRFLTPSEKAFVVQRLAEDHGAAGEAPFAWSHLTAAVTDWRVWTYALIYIGVAEPLYSLALFVPTIISSLGHFTLPQAQLLSTPPYFLAFAFTLTSAVYSDRIKNRGYFNIFWMLLVMIGYAIQIGVNPKTSPGAAYCVNIGPVYKKATGMGIIVYFKKDAPRNFRGHSVGLGFAAMAVILSTVMTIANSRENARRDALYGNASSYQGDKDDKDPDAEQRRIAQNTAWGLDRMTEEQVTALGDRHPGFRYFP
ncbi:hypothetical protein RQP46_007665 [Phenoliferia psychrophenolica]